LIGHVLKPFRGEELKLFGKVINCTAGAVTDIYRNGIDAAMNKYNGLVMAA
jgi:peptidyl-tRNA hydrolase